MMMALAEIPGRMPLVIPVVSSLTRIHSSPQQKTQSDSGARCAIYGPRLQQEIHCVLPPIYQTDHRMAGNDVAVLWTCMKHVPHSKEPSIRAGRPLIQPDLLMTVVGRGGAKTVRRRQKRKSLYTRHVLIIPLLMIATCSLRCQQIQPGDSLPGIALKYHVSLATLRNTNKLWANDTIHLRQVLYIPTQAIASSKTNSVSHLSRGRPEYPTHSNHFTPEVQTGTFPRRGHDSAAPNTISTGNTSATIKRVPLSELSFFPPSSTSALSPPSEPKSLTIPPKSNHTGIPPPSSFNNFSIRGASTFGLANLLNGAKDEIISRLSFDSTRGSSDAASEERHDVELEIVRGPRRARRRGSVTDDDDRDGEWISQPANGVAFAMHSVAEQDSVILNTPRKPKVIRTVQLQPSPTMVIPASGL